MSIQVNDKNLGHATAYAYAVAGGYTGTEAEFTELLGNIADDLEQIENLTVTVETLAAGSSATASYSNGVLHLGIPKGDKGDGAYHIELSGESFVIHTDASGVAAAQEFMIYIDARQGTTKKVISRVEGLPSISTGSGTIAPEIIKHAFTGSVATIIYTIPANTQISAGQINAQYTAYINDGTANGFGVRCALSVAVVKDGAKGDTGATGSTGPTGNGIASVTKTGTSGLVDTYTITYTNGNTSTFTVTNGAEAVDNTLTIAGRAADAKKTGDEISELKEDLTTKADLDELYKAFPTDTASGSVASFADGANVPVKSLIVNIDPVQSGSGDPSPTNVRPISGWSGVNVTACGNNLFDSNFSDYTKPYDYYIKPIKLESGKSYVIKAELVGTAVTGTAFGVTKKGDKYSEFTPYIVVASSGNVYSFKFTVDDTFTSPKLVAYASGQAKFDEVMSNYNITLEVKADQNPYEPYSSTFLNIALGQTVYGGKLDVTNGVLTTYPYYASYNGETLTGAWISDRDKYVSGTTPTTGAQVVNIGGAGTDVQLTPHEVRSLLGSNNIWADTGDSTVTYRADPTLYISRLTEPDADMIADANITSGSYFMVGNTLYKATANIANGSAIVPNTNCTRKSLSEALNELNS